LKLIPLKILLVLYFMFPISDVFAQGDKTSWGLGTSAIYNFQTEGFGTELRAHIYLLDQLVLAPEVSYFPSFNIIHEMYAGLAVHYEFPILNEYSPYIALGAWYNDWINAEKFAIGVKKKNNFAPEAGFGIVRNTGCFRPYIEYRYDMKWQEGNLRIGILVFFRACKPQKYGCIPVRM
jgi:hypothetical protein